ncbi:hypothetical protein SETIT_7G230700v2 [Setaria italica]|uniref:Uncharacterized protein n=1 Tax=Setaria italica TaxID=4555 RepID=A0A368RYR9_SETIT|nr:hypothetical protein SETIT_7G230700v2 [Setaria italica]
MARSLPANRRSRTTPRAGALHGRSATPARWPLPSHHPAAQCVESLRLASHPLPFPLPAIKDLVPMPLPAARPHTAVRHCRRFRAPTSGHPHRHLRASVPSPTTTSPPPPHNRPPPPPSSLAPEQKRPRRHCSIARPRRPFSDPEPHINPVVAHDLAAEPHQNRASRAAGWPRGHIASYGLVLGALVQNLGA